MGFRATAKRAYDFAFNRRVLARRPHLLVVGDSHAVAVRAAARRPELKARVSLCTVVGATAQGLVNPNSRTDAIGIFERRIDRAKTWQPLVFQLGEVDCGFVIWYRAEKHGLSVESQLGRCMKAYGEMLERQADAGFRIIVVSAPPPTIVDGQDWGEIANLRREVRASLRDRTALTQEYNLRLQQTAERMGLQYVDATSPMLDPETGLVGSQFRNRDPTNHHLEEAAYARVLAPRLSDALARLDGRQTSANQPAHSG